MKRFTLETLPEHARYIGSENADGTLYEAAADRLAEALEPAFIREDDGTRSFFDIAKVTT